jgi:hypothetical protein
MKKVPVVCWVARLYCPTAGMTFSLLPDVLAARMPGTLEQVQQAGQAGEHFEQSKVALERRPFESGSVGACNGWHRSYAGRGAG